MNVTYLYLGTPLCLQYNQHFTPINIIHKNINKNKTFKNKETGPVCILKDGMPAICGKYVSLGGQLSFKHTGLNC